ncbi:MAG: hypothetical protein A2V70_15080 [Planctomycetes bacterium RBG_13_63_9]|nr:MAG: hypothetical protein A2V70_15080 [Planctomycetes bacterium RBG_13_63_9]
MALCAAFATATVLAVTVLRAPCMAAEKSLYQPVGAPVDPKVSAQWNRYHDHQQATKLLEALAEKHPERARLQTLGTSYGGREMWLLSVTSFEKGDDRSKPAFWIDGAIHANEIQATEVTLYTAWYLLEMYGRNPTVTRLVDGRTFYLMPMMNPDSRDAHMHRPNTTNSPRSGQRPVDDDRDGLVDEDGPDDLDGDGHITQMRIADPNGRFKPHPKYPNLLVRVEDDERGEYTLLGMEGYDNDGDGRINEDGDGRYDPNRDWAWCWQPAYVQEGAHHYPFSILENRMVADFIMAHPNIAGAQTYHNAGGMILRGPGSGESPYDPADVKVYDAIAEKGQLVLPGYRYYSIADDLYGIHGGEISWLHGMRGIFTFCNELFSSKSYFRKPSDERTANRDEEQQAFDKYVLLGEGTVPWKEVDHPQFGKVEVGGLKKSWGRQPPSFLLEEECHRNMAFTLYHADQMPQVAIQSVQARAKRPGLVEVTAVVANRKLTPTHSAVDLKHKITPPDVVTIEGEGIRVVMGMAAFDRFFRKAKEQPLRPECLRIDGIRGMGAVYVRWLVEGEGPYRVTVRSIKGGSDRREVNR